jgi:hypothetical protein
VHPWLLECPQPSFRSQFEICACGFHSRQHDVCTLWPCRWHAQIRSAPISAAISAPISGSRPYRTDGTRTAVFDRGSTHVPRRDIVVNGPPPIRLHLSVHVIVHLVIVLWHSIGDGLLWPSCAWGSGRGRLLRVVLMSTAAAAAAAGRDGPSGAGGGLPCALASAIQHYTFEK